MWHTAVTISVRLQKDQRDVSANKIGDASMHILCEEIEKIVFRKKDAITILIFMPVRFTSLSEVGDDKTGSSKI